MRPRSIGATIRAYSKLIVDHMVECCQQVVSVNLTEVNVHLEVIP